MSLQVCGCCGWSKKTTYHGLRTHQGKMGCTPKGLRIPESERFRLNSYIPKYTYVPSPIKVEEPSIDFFKPSIKPADGWSNWRSLFNESPQTGSRPSTDSTPVKTESLLMSLPQPFSNQLNPVVEETNEDYQESLFQTPQRSHQTATNVRRALDLFTDNQQTEQTLDLFKYPAGGQIQFPDSLLTSLPQLFSNQLNPTVEETNQSLFQTPQRSHQTATDVRRALDFTIDAQQTEQTLDLFKYPAGGQIQFPDLAQQAWGLPAATVQDTPVQLTEEREEEREAQKLLKERQDRMRADIQKKIQMREQNMAEVRSSAKACKGSLDAEWQEINSVFTEVIRVVEDARKQALQPVEERRLRVEKEAQDLVQKLQNETDKLRISIDELEKNPDLQVLPLTGLDGSLDWGNATLDSFCSLGTLRSKTSNMMEQIHQKLEKLSSVELKRIPEFAVDVKLDQNTAHHFLVLSPDGKEVKDGGKSQKVPDAPGRFDIHGSILGLNRLTSGRFYWEVEVGNKTGWDLGVARRNANRKGILSLKPENGYWVTVHYEDKKYAALTAPPISLSLTAKPQKVGVFVDLEEGLVSFYDMTAQTHIYSFTGCSFGGEIVPYFSPHLEQNGKNSDPLIISAVKKQ